jgi:hypothetical protein
MSGYPTGQADPKFIELLQALQNPQNEVRSQAEKMFEQAKATNASECLKSMATVVLDPAIDEPVILYFKFLDFVCHSKMFNVILQAI